MAAELTQLPESTVTLSFDTSMIGYGARSQRLFDISKSYEIDSQEMLAAASDELKLIKSFAKELETKEKELTKPLNDLKTKLIDFFRPARNNLALAEQQLKGSIDGYLTAQEQKRLAAQAEAERLARVERARLAAEAKRIADEAAEQQRKAYQEQVRIQAEARKAQEAGDAITAAALKQQAREEEIRADEARRNAQEETQALHEQALFVPTPIVAAQVQKVSGMTQTHTYTAELIDKMALIKAVASGQVPDIYLDVNMALLNKQAKALKDQLNIAGVKAVRKSGISQRT